MKKSENIPEEWVLAQLADPVSKQPAGTDFFAKVDGVLDARIFMKNTYGYSEWAEGQDEYESSLAATDGEYQNIVKAYSSEREYDRPVYEHFKLQGTILDVGGGASTVREFLPETAQVVSIDPSIDSAVKFSAARMEAYKCLSRPLNFIAAAAEFLPFSAESFDWVHIRSVIDHLQVPDLALLEAHRVLKPDGHVLIGLYVEGGKSGKISWKRKCKKIIKHGLELAGIKRWHDHHLQHPTYKDLVKLIEDNGFKIEDVYWQPCWHDQVCYICACKS